MNKKKVALTVLLSALLALSVAFCIFEFSKKTKDVMVQPVDNVENRAEIPQNNQLKKDVVSGEKNKKSDSVKNTVKKSNTITEKNDTKQGEKTKQIETVSEKPDEKVEENNVSQEEGVIIPVHYVSNNTYKYTYTPKRYPKNSLNKNQ